MQNWHSANINDKEQSFCFYWKICCSLAYYSDQSSSWSTFKSKNQLRIRKRMLSLWKLVGYFINYQDLEIPGNLSKICTTFLNLNHLTLLWWRGLLPYIFVFFYFLKNDCKYQIQYWHLFKANEIPSDQHRYEYINVDLDWETCKKTVLVTIKMLFV